MTESHRQNLLQACAFARVFIDSADHELKGGDSSWRIEATPQLSAALRSLTTCECSHSFQRHEGDTGGHCMDCPCLEFTEC